MCGSDMEHEEEIMEKFIPYEKLSKKEKRKMDLARRQTWGELNPVTRRPENSRAYNRNKTRNWNRDDHEPIPGFLISFFPADQESFSQSDQWFPERLHPLCRWDLPDPSLPDGNRAGRDTGHYSPW